jgi:orotidine-5'-phosphate decarboxylase
MSFNEKLANAIKKNSSRVCVGLDVDINKMPDQYSKDSKGVLEFNKMIIGATKDYVCSYKPNMAFYEALGLDGIEVLKETIDMIPNDIPVIVDAKRGDIGNTAKQYAKAIFEDLGGDAVTLAPYMGYDSVGPFLEYADKTSFILCVTSNKGSVDFQKQKIGDKYLYEIVAQKCNEWNVNKNVGLVVGATNPTELKVVRDICPDVPFLIPGVGAQGGSAKECVDNALTDSGEIVINSSRGIIYADDPKQACIELRNHISSS